jgi:quercetin dioxygenase-like cupin family protein
MVWAQTDRYVGKVLHIRKGHRLSLQYHRVKMETILLTSGRMTLLLESDQGKLDEFDVRPGDAFEIHPNRKHRMIAVEDCQVMEVSTPELDDVVRLEDGYGRV